MPYDSELKNLIFRDFHAKLYLDHLGYLNTLTVVKRFYYWLNLKMDMENFGWILRLLASESRV